MNTTHEPDPRFVENLEGMLASARRRREAFGPVRADTQKRRSLKMFAIILCSILSGVVATATTTHFQDVAQGKLLLTQADTRIQLADSHVDHTRRELLAIKERVALGVVSPEMLDQISVEVARLEIVREVLESEREELSLSYEPVRNALSAPLVGGRDFVTDRLRLEVKSLRISETDAKGRREKIQRRVAIGLAASSELNSVKEELARIAQAIEEIDRKLVLRDRFLRGEIPAEKVDLLGLIAEAEERVKLARVEAENVQQELASMERKFQLGLISTPEMERLRFAAESAKSNIKLADIELQILQRNLNK